MKNQYTRYRKKTFTVDDIMGFNPCFMYRRVDVKGLFGGKKRLTIQNVLDLDIDISDRVWVLIHLFTADQRKKFGCSFLRKIYDTGVEKRWNASVLQPVDDCSGFCRTGTSGSTFWSAYEAFSKWIGICSDRDYTAPVPTKWEEKTIKQLRKFLVKHGYLGAKK